MRRDVNLLLFGLLLLLLVTMVVMVIYAQYEYQRLNTDYLATMGDLTRKESVLGNKSVEINKTRDELESAKRELADLIGELNLSEEREVSLGGLFEGLKGEKELLRENLDLTSMDRDRWHSNYTAAKNELAMCRKDYELKEMQLDSVTQKVSRISRNVKSMGISINKSRGYITGIEDGLEDIDDDLYSLYQKVGDVEDGSLREDLKDDINGIRDLIGELNDIITDLRNKMDSMEKKVREME